GEKLVGGEAGLGAATALSRDGNTALIGGSPDAFNASTAAVFTRSGSTWTRQSRLWEGYGRGYPRVRVALSSDASTALINGLNGEGFESVPVARVFRSSGTTWIEQAPTL